MGDLSNITEGAAAGGLGAGLVAWIVRMFVKNKLDQLDKNTADILEIKQSMVTRQDLDSTADDLRQKARDAYRRCHALEMRMDPDTRDAFNRWVCAQYVTRFGRLESDGMPVLAEAFVRVKLA